MTMFLAQEVEVDHDVDISQVTNVVKTMARQNESCRSWRRNNVDSMTLYCILTRFCEKNWSNLI